MLQQTTGLERNKGYSSRPGHCSQHGGSEPPSEPRPSGVYPDLSTVLV